MNEKKQEHFDRISQRYQRAADSWHAIYDQMEIRISPLVKGKVVLDVGNGGRFAYDTSLPEKVIAMDISPKMLDEIKNPKVIKVVGDARDMLAIKDGSVDIIILLLVLHHITGSNKDASIEALDSVISSAHDKLRPGGHLIITEALLSPLLFKVQCLSFQLTRSILSRLGVPMIFFFSLPVISERIIQKFQIKSNDIEVMHLKLNGWMDPFGGSFPDVVKIPVELIPWDFCLLIASKCSNKAT